MKSSLEFGGYHQGADVDEIETMRYGQAKGVTGHNGIKETSKKADIF